MYFKVFVNYKQNNLAKLFLKTVFTYNNTKNENINYILFEFNYKYYSQI